MLAGGDAPKYLTPIQIKPNQDKVVVMSHENVKMLYPTLQTSPPPKTLKLAVNLV
jgi:hypothetical protein